MTTFRKPRRKSRASKTPRLEPRGISETDAAYAARVKRHKRRIVEEREMRAARRKVTKLTKTVAKQLDGKGLPKKGRKTAAERLAENLAVQVQGSLDRQRKMEETRWEEEQKDLPPPQPSPIEVFKTISWYRRFWTWLVSTTTFN